MNQWSSDSTPQYAFIEGTGINLFAFVTLMCEEREGERQQIVWTEGRETTDIGNNGMCTFIG
jgi:hypothetical protein